MSSLSRRACFKCGNVGHYAGEPPSHMGYGTRCTKTLSGRLSQDGAFGSYICIACLRAVYDILGRDKRLTRSYRGVLFV